MGLTFHLGCRDCREYVWAGQNAAGNQAGWLYSTPEASAKLWRFLRKHEDHILYFLEAQSDDDGEEFEPDPDD